MNLRDRQWARPLVVGASGQVGAQLCRALEESGSGQVLQSGRTPQQDALQLDLSDLRIPADAARAVQGAEPDLILCAGAMTFVDGCEARPEEALRANAYGPSVLAAYAHERGIPFVYFSSDYVFDGTAEHPGPYDEAARTHPLSVYGQSKLEGERAVLRVHPEALVVRTSWVYGPDPAGKNFITALVRQLRAGTAVRVPYDQVSTPTFNRDLADVTLQLVGARISGVVHATGPDLVSRLELAQLVARFFQLDAGLLEGVATADLGQRARRPLRSGLRSARIDSELSGFRLRRLEEGLQLMEQALQA